MSFPSSLLPQADSLAEVEKVVLAVSNGAKTYQEIARALGKVDRQGRYYRLAAEQIGLLEPTSNNFSQITARGADLIRATSDAERRAIIVKGVMGNPVLREVVNHVRDGGESGRTLREVAEWIEQKTTASGGTPMRRASTVRNWLEEVGICSWDGAKLSVRKFPIDALAPEEADPFSPIIKTPPSMAPFGNARPQPIDHLDPDYVAYLIDRARRERAYKKHEDIVTRLANELREAGFECARNKFVDLFAADRSSSFLFEIKTCNQKNVRSQIRRALSQLHEYQYQQDLPNSKLVLVLEDEPLGRNRWLIEYITVHRGILLVWETKKGFEGPGSSEIILRWLPPQAT